MTLIELTELAERLSKKRSQYEAGKFYENYVYSKEDHKTVIKIVNTFIEQETKKQILL